VEGETQMGRKASSMKQEKIKPITRVPVVEKKRVSFTCSKGKYWPAQTETQVIQEREAYLFDQFQKEKKNMHFASDHPLIIMAHRRKARYI
jgi:hypothetical protein